MRFLALFFAMPACASVSSIAEKNVCGTMQNVQAVRFSENPLFDINTDHRLGNTINGPSVIATPDWIANRLGAYYMYFADHRGDHIKLAYADSPMGPWTLYEPGTLQLQQAIRFQDHIASPDIYIDQDNQKLRMYFHGVLTDERQQKTGVAFSADGLSFDASDDVQGLFYFRVFRYNDWFYALAKNNNEGFMAIYRGKTGISDWEFGGNFLPDARHAAVDIQEDTLSIYYSRVGDAPERIVKSTVDLSDDWTDWVPSAPIEVLRPVEIYEGVEHPIAASTHGPATDVAQLRDPAILRSNDRVYLYYAGEGEETLNGAELQCTAD